MKTNIARFHFFMEMMAENIDKMDAMISSGFEFDSLDQHNQTILSQAVVYQKALSVDFLLSKGADIHRTYNYGFSLLHFSLMHAEKDIFDIRITKNLLKKGINSYAFDQNGKTSLMDVTSKNFGQTGNINRLKDVIEIMMDFGYDPYFKDKEGNDYFDYLKKYSKENLISYVLSKLDKGQLDLEITEKNEREAYLKF